MNVLRQNYFIVVWLSPSSSHINDNVMTLAWVSNYPPRSAKLEQQHVVAAAVGVGAGGAARVRGGRARGGVGRGAGRVRGAGARGGLRARRLLPARAQGAAAARATAASRPHQLASTPTSYNKTILLTPLNCIFQKKKHRFTNKKKMTTATLCWLDICFQVYEYFSASVIKVGRPQ